MGQSRGLTADERVRELEARLADKERELKRVQDELEHFVYAVSHDLQEPLRTAVSFSEIVLGRHAAELGQQGADHLGRVMAAGRRMQAMLDGLLKYSRITRRGSAPRPTRAEPAWDAVAAKARLSAPEADLSRGPLPTVLADTAQLIQLFDIVVDNALKFRPKDRPARVRAEAERSGADWVFSISDEGIGLDPRDAERVFRMFERLNGRNDYPGAGVGLALAHRIVQRHGGRIWIESEPGRGARVRFTFRAA